MSRQLEQAREVRQSKRVKKLGRIIDYELEGAVAHAGGDLIGLSVKISPGDVLVTLRIILAGRRQVAFVGSETLGGALIKAVDLAKQDKLPLRADKYEK